jgi:two-component system, NtrC family, sensor histidine kinase HydH
MTSPPPPPSYAHFDAFALPTLVVRAGEVVYVNAPMLGLLERAAPAVLGQPVWLLLDPGEQGAVRERYQRRMRGEPVPSTYETRVVAGDGSSRQVELSLERCGELDVVVFARDVTARAGRRQLMLELARLGTSLPSTAGTEEAVLARLFEGLEALGLAFSWLLPEPGGRVRIARAWALAQVRSDFEAGTGHTLEGLTGSLSPKLAQAWEEGAAYGDDYALEAAQFVDAPLAGFTREMLLRRGQVHFIVVRVDVQGQPRALLRLAGRWLRAEDLPVLRLFGAQVSAALDSAWAIQDLSNRNTALAALDRLATAAARAPDPQAFFATGIREVRGLLDCAGASLFLVSPDGQHLELMHAEGPGMDTLGAIRRMPMQGTQMGEVIRTGQARVLSTDQSAAAVRPLLAAQGLQTLAIIPLQLHRRAMGTLSLGFTEQRTLSEVELETLHAMGAHFAAAAETNRLLDEARRRAEDLAIVHEVGHSLTGTLELQQLLDRGVVNLARIVDAPDAYLFLADPAGERLEIRAAAGAHPELVGLYLPAHPPDSSLVARVFQTRELALVEDARVDSRVNPELRRRELGLGYLALALVVRERTVGVAVISETRRPRRFTPGEVERAAAVANQLAVALDSARLYEDLKRSYAELARAHAQLVHTERLAALGELSAVVAHEVRNPLGAIFNAVASLKRQAGPHASSLPLLEIVSEESERLNHIVNDLLEFARPAQPQLRPLPLTPLLREAVGAALGAASGPLRLEWALPEEALAPVPMDERLLRQVFLNLAQNAVQAMPQGGLLHVRVAPQPGAHESLAVELTDSGPGVPAELRGRIFEPFFTTRAQGTGLGLALVKRIVEAHAGSVEVTAGPGGGARFRVVLPVAPPARERGVLGGRQ